MKKFLLLLCISFFSCSTNKEDVIIDTSIPISFDKLKAYNKSTAFFYYSPDPTRVGNSRIYLDTVSGLITQYTSHRTTNQSDTSEKFAIQTTKFYKNYKNTNIDYVFYILNSHTYKDIPKIIVLCNDKSDKFIFYRIYNDNPELFKDDFQNQEYYKKFP